METLFKGVIPVVVTPFKKDGSFDFPAARKHLDWLAENGVQSVCILGATGEYQSLNDEEHQAYVAEIAPYASERFVVYMGASRERPDDVVKLMENGKKHGVAAAMVLPPFYYHAPQDEIVRNYRFINDRVDLPIMIYNNPGSCGYSIDFDTFGELFKLKNVRIIKESSGDIAVLTKLLGMAPEGVSLFCGTENLAFESFAVGACGWISVAGNFAPKTCLELHDLIVDKKDLAGAMKVYRKLLPALELLESFPKTAQTVKHILAARRGIPAGYVRTPRHELSEEEKAYVLGACDLDALR